MAVGKGGPEIIDSDGHVVEPDSVWSEYADPEHREFLSSAPGGGVQRLAMQRAYPDANVDEVLDRVAARRECRASFRLLPITFGLLASAAGVAPNHEVLHSNYAHHPPPTRGY